MTRLRSIIRQWQIASVMLALAGCAGETAHRQGIEMLSFGRQEEGLAKLEQAAREAPDNPVYVHAYRNAQQRIVFRLLAEAQVEKSAGRFDAAEALYCRVLTLDSVNADGIAGLVAVEQARRHAVLISEAKALIGANDLEAAERKIAVVLEENPAQAEARALRQSITEKSGGEQVVTPALRKSFQQPTTLEFHDANIKQVLEALSTHSGLNFVLDKDVPANLAVTVFLRDVSVAQALDVILTTNQLKQRVLNDTTLLIYPDTVAKQDDHQDLVVRNFFLANAEAKQVLTMLQTVLKLKHVYADDKLNLLIVRDTPATIQLAERLVATQDVAEPEVMLELAVVEVTRSQLSNLGIQFPNQLTLTPLPSTGNTLTLKDLGNLNSSRVGAGISPLNINLQDDTNATNLLANPRIRTHNREKALIRIGDRVPIITTTATSTGFVSENVQYVDVGLKLEVEPTIYPNDEIAIKLALEVSALGAQSKSAAGTISYQISGRNAATVLRLKDGETQVLGGLINDDDKKTANRFPGLSQFPVLGRLFASENNNNLKTELVLSITPRIVRGLVPPSQVPNQFWSGTENNPSLRSAVPPKASNDADKAPVAPAPAPAVPATPEPAAAAPALLHWDGPAEVAVGGTFKLALQVSSQARITDFPLQVKYDPVVLEAIDVMPGGFMAQGDAKTLFSKRIAPADGLIVLSQKRTGGTDNPMAGANGDGPLVEIEYRALKPSPATRVTTLAADPLGSGGQVLGQVGPAAFAITVSP